MVLLRKIKNLLSGHKALVLMYHRIDDLEIDPWQLAVSTINFEQQLQLIQNKHHVVSATELIGELNTGRIKKNSICITFDDGYRDNFLNAAPLLKRYSCPATFFIATGFINQEKMFWWDILTEIFLISHKLPEILQIGGLNFTLDNNGEMSNDQFEKHKSWKWPEPAPTQRCAVYLAVWEYIRPLPNDELIKNIEFLIEWSGIEFNTPTEALPMNDRHLEEIANEKLFSLGVHTVNHPALGSQSKPVQEKELSGSRDMLYQHFDNNTDAVAYPYGHYNEETLDIMKNENFEAGFTTEERSVSANSDIYRLGRFQVKNWTGAELNEQLIKWFNE